MPQSIWQETASLPRFSGLTKDINTDVLIIGGGLAGVLTAYMLSKEGVDCAVAEARYIGGGITSGTTAKITSQHGLIYDKLIHRFGVEYAKRYLAANEAAIARYAELCQAIDCDFERKDNYVYSLDGSDELRREQDALMRLDFSADIVTCDTLPFDAPSALRFRNQAQFHPLRFLCEISRGLDIYELTRVRELQGTRAISGGGTISAKRIVVATHFPFINKHGSYFMKMHQQRSYVIALENAPDVEGMYIDARENGLSFRNGQGLLLLGGGGHRTGKKGGGWDELRRFANERYPKAKEVANWAAQDCMTLDGAPYIGRYSRCTENMYVATGFNKWGITSAMVSATLLCDMLTGRKSPYESVFTPSRTMLRPQLAINALESTVNLLTPTAKRCPHLGCALKRNTPEHSWDCPCHGSRFTEAGELIDNPATGNLKESEASRK